MSVRVGRRIVKAVDGVPNSSMLLNGKIERGEETEREVIFEALNPPVA